MSNAVAERDASAVKRVKTRLRSRLNPFTTGGHFSGQKEKVPVTLVAPLASKKIVTIFYYVAWPIYHLGGVSNCRLPRAGMKQCFPGEKSTWFHTKFSSYSTF